jgi:hypothetical protein
MALAIRPPGIEGEPERDAGVLPITSLCVGRLPAGIDDDLAARHHPPGDVFPVRLLLGHRLRRGDAAIRAVREELLRAEELRRYIRGHYGTGLTRNGGWWVFGGLPSTLPSGQNFWTTGYTSNTYPLPCVVLQSKEAGIGCWANPAKQQREKQRFPIGNSMLCKAHFGIVIRQ